MRKRNWPPSIRTVKAAYKTSGKIPTTSHFLSPSGRYCCPIGALICAGGLERALESNTTSMTDIKRLLSDLGFNVTTEDIRLFTRGFDAFPVRAYTLPESRRPYDAGRDIRRAILPQINQ